MLDHYQAIKAMLPTDLTVYLGGTPAKDADIVYPYAIVWGPALDEPADTVDDVPSHIDGWVRITYVGLGFDAAAKTAARVRSALNRRSPQVPGRVCEKLRLSPLRGIESDPDVVDVETGLNPYSGVDEFHLVSQQT